MPHRCRQCTRTFANSAALRQHYAAAHVYSVVVIVPAQPDPKSEPKCQPAPPTIEEALFE
jgi:hypothetical protein